MIRQTLILLTVLLVGCGPLIPLPGDAPKRYNLSHIQDTHTPRLSEKQLIVDMPTTSVFLDTQRVAVMPAPQQVDYYANMEWAERLQQVVQESVTYSLQNLNLYRAVTRQNDGIIPDQLLKIDIRKFQISQGTPDVAQAEFYVQLINVVSRDEIARQTFTANIPLSSDHTPTADDVAAALDQANKKAISDIAAWLRKTL